MVLWVLVKIHSQWLVFLLAQRRLTNSMLFFTEELCCPVISHPIMCTLYKELVNDQNWISEVMADSAFAYWLARMFIHFL